MEVALKYCVIGFAVSKTYRLFNDLGIGYAKSSITNIYNS